VQATVGYQFTETISAEIGYRYLDTDYSDGDFIYDVAEHGVYTGLNIRF
jgi:opacity protein-like surface antigen